MTEWTVDTSLSAVSSPGSSTPSPKETTMNTLKQYRKTITAVVAAVAGWVGLVVFSDSAAITSAEWYAGLVAVLGALGVFAIPNGTQQPAE